MAIKPVKNINVNIIKYFIVQSYIKRPIRTRGDCELISNVILETLNLDISYNTIRRLSKYQISNQGYTSHTQYSTKY